MAVTIKTPEQIELMREAGRILDLVHKELEKSIRPGISTKAIDKIGEECIRSYGCIPSFLGYEGYPASVCVSVNDEVVHGIPSDDFILEEGDIVSLDTGVIYKGWQSDAARTHGVGMISKEDEKLIEITKQSFFEGIKAAKAGNHLNDIGTAIEKFIKPYGYGIVRDLTGHGIGSNMHEDPMVPNFHTFRRGIVLQPGMTLAVEPMINAGTWKVGWLDDEWTVVTADGKNSAHYENTILITEGEPEILSLR